MSQVETYRAYSCDRCHQEHMKVAALKFDQYPPYGFTHWFMCPIKYEPVFIWIPQLRTNVQL